MQHSIFKNKAKKRYTFADYYKLNSTAAEIVAEFGYSLSLETIELPQGPVSPEKVAGLQSAYYRNWPRIVRPSEAAKREILIAPLLIEVMQDADATLDIESPLEVNDKLNGFLDYLLRAKQEIVVVEAKRGDPDKGFNQLMAELIALDMYEKENPTTTLYGAVTLGNWWSFAVLQRPEKRIARDLHSYRIPEDLGQVFSILVGILQPANSQPMGGK